MEKEINGHKLKLFIRASEIKQKVQDLGSQITKDYAGKNLLIIAVLKGSFIFLADLMRSIDIDIEVDFIRASSYKNKMKPGKVDIVSKLEIPIKDRHVLLVEDLLDTGGTLEVIREHILSKRPASFKICALLNKRKDRKSEISLSYVGFEIYDKFVVGYGTDFAEQGRNLPDLYVIE